MFILCPLSVFRITGGNSYSISILSWANRTDISFPIYTEIVKKNLLVIVDTLPHTLFIIITSKQKKRNK